MQIHQFELDAPIDQENNTLSDQYFFFYDEKRVLSAWITRILKDKLLIIVYQELMSGNMKIVDIKELATTPKSIEVSSSGILVLSTKGGSLQVKFKTGSIQLKATNNAEPNQKPWNNESLQFAGMKITDQVILKKRKLTKYTTTSKDYYGDLFMEESVLCSSANNDNLARKINTNPYILIGNGKLSTQLELIPCIHNNLFQIPIISFTLNYTLPTNRIEILGWNRRRLQAIQIECYADNSKLDTIDVVDSTTKELDNAILKDKSTLYNDYRSHMAILVDENRPYQFYCLKPD